MRPEIESLIVEAVVFGQPRGSAGPAVVDRQRIKVIPTVRLGRNIKNAFAVGRPHRVEIEMHTLGQGRGFAAGHVEQPQIDALVIVIRGIGDPTAVRRPDGRGIVIRPRGQFIGRVVIDADFPNRPGHAEGNLLSVGRKVRTPGRARRRRQVIVVHVVAAGLGQGIDRRPLRRRGPANQAKQQEQRTELKPRTNHKKPPNRAKYNPRRTRPPGLPMQTPETCGSTVGQVSRPAHSNAQDFP